jgi:DeoR/GlpR family transcriptional regulator of sugar metabolism
LTFRPQPFTILHPDIREVEVKQALLQTVSQVIRVADSSKYGVTRLVKIAPMNAIHMWISDDSLPEQTTAEIEAAGVTVITPRRMTAQAVIH